jgi:hypothetical protein
MGNALGEVWEAVAELGRHHEGLLLLLNVRGCSKLAEDRNIWRQTLKKPGPDAGCRTIKD